MKFHPAAESFPMMDRARFQAIIDRLYTHGRRIELLRRGEPPVIDWDVMAAMLEGAP